MCTVVFFIAGAMWLTTELVTRRATKSLLDSLTQQALDRAEAELTTFFDPIEASLGQVQSWVSAGLITTEDAQSAFETLQPLMIANPHLTSVGIGDRDGNVISVLRIRSGTSESWKVWKVRQTHPAAPAGERGPTLALLIDIGDSEPDWNAPLGEVDGFQYDPAARPWWAQAVGIEELGEIDWTEPYQFFDPPEPGITAMSRVVSKGKSVV